ncbi:hypothetical protein [Janthinobacterium sp.]|jgi:hypothetical protein|uniref:hypothetical protein n=1 Tax=Janthinobacterium sp. TaxID=1871054 RepID=UPI0028978756|nr:hypothetical protein [Janthinobacterium sp.]
MIRCVRIWTGPDGDSLFEEGHLALSRGERGDVLSKVLNAASISWRETGGGGAFARHNAPARQFVLTLGGTPEFRCADGATFRMYPGDMLLAEDTTGTGHSWRLLGDAPWRRAYVIVGADAGALFIQGDPS